MIIHAKIRLVTLVAFLLLLCSTIYAQQLTRHQSVGAYIYNFAKNIRWRNEQEISQFKFHFIGEDQDIIDVLNRLANTETLRGKPIEVTNSRSMTELGNIHLIYVEESRKNLLNSVLNAIQGRNILLISDGYADMRKIMINFVNMPGNRLVFEINMANIILYCRENL